MQYQSRVIILAGIFFASCLLLCAGIYWPVKALREYREEYRDLNVQRVNLESIIEALTATNRILSEISDLPTTKFNTDSQIINFHRQIITAAEYQGMNILSATQNENSITLSLQGGYYNFVGLLSELRAMPYASRITDLKIATDNDNPAYFVKADMTLEIMSAE